MVALPPAKRPAPRPRSPPAQLLCQKPENEGSELVADILKILYATEDGFVAPEAGAEEEATEY